MAKRRIFAAFDLSDYARDRVVEYVGNIQTDFANLRVRWERADKLHITLYFAGDLEDVELADLEKRIAAVAATASPFVLTISGTGAFIKRRTRSSVLWLGVKSGGSLERLATGLDPETSRFNPHLTIARLKDAKGCRELINRHLANEFSPIEFDAAEIVVYESKLMPAGSVYKAISRHPLRRN